MATASLIAAAALIQTQIQAPPDLSWLAGYWLDCSNGREVSETWSDPRGGLIVGHNVTLRGGRAGFEAAHIGPTAGGGLAYYAQPAGAPATAFVLIAHEPGRAVFENLENDFPHRILYTRDGDTLTARIEGEINGQARAVDWRFQKAELNTRCSAS